MGELRADLQEEIFLWRPILAGKLTYSDVYSGAADLVTCLKINAILDMQDATALAAEEQAKRKSSR